MPRKADTKRGIFVAFISLMPPQWCICPDAKPFGTVAELLIQMYLVVEESMVRKLLVSLSILLLAAGHLIAGVSITPTVGGGYSTGSRAFSSDPLSFRKLATSGIEVGTVVGYDISPSLRAEAYFDYLIALRGDVVSSKDQSTSPQPIASDLTYTNYKAGLGLGYFVPINAKNSFRVSTGINFAGVSNHLYSSADAPRRIESEMASDKVTSFGFYLGLADHYHHTDKIDFVASLHLCYNTFGWIRTLENHRWVNHFNEKAEIRFLSVFAQLGVGYRF